MPACPVHHTVVDKTSSWDGPAEEKKFDKVAGTFVKFYAWIDKGETDVEADGTDKEDGWGPHHECNAKGIPGAANLKGVEAAMAALNGAHGGSSRIPSGDRQGVWDHLAAHYRDGGVADADIPELKSGGIAARAIRSELRNVPERRISARREFELREIPNGTGGTNLRFTGFASVTTPGDGTGAYTMEDWLGPWTESVSVGAFAKTITDGADVAFLLNHEGMTLARTKPGTLKLSEVTTRSKSPVYGVTGLYSEALLDPQNMYVQAMRSAVDRGDLDEMSFAFRVTRQEWNEDYTRRWINEVNLNQGDVSLVNYAANPITAGTVSIRQRRPAGLVVPGRRRHGRRDDTGTSCNRCTGTGTVTLAGTSIPCPLCKGTGTGENNAGADEALALLAAADVERTRARLEELRKPPSTARERLEALRCPPPRPDVDRPPAAGKPRRSMKPVTGVRRSPWSSL